MLFPDGAERKNENEGLVYKTITMIIGMIAFIIFFIWGYLDTFEHSWLAFVIGVMACGVVRMVRKDKEEAAKKRENTEE